MNTTSEKGTHLMGQMHIMGSGGDTKLTWRPDKPDDVDAARRAFDDLRARGFNAYAVGRRGKGELVTEFDPDAARIILAPPMLGG